MQQAKYLDKKHIAVTTIKTLASMLTMLWFVIAWATGLVAIAAGTSPALSFFDLQPGTFEARFIVSTWLFWLFGYIMLGFLGIGTWHIWTPKIGRFFFEKESSIDAD